MQKPGRTFSQGIGQNVPLTLGCWTPTYKHISGGRRLSAQFRQGVCQPAKRACRSAQPQNILPPTLLDRLVMWLK